MSSGYERYINKVIIIIIIMIFMNFVLKETFRKRAIQALSFNVIAASRHRKTNEAI